MSLNRKRKTDKNYLLISNPVGFTFRRDFYFNTEAQRAQINTEV